MSTVTVSSEATLLGPVWWLQILFGRYRDWGNIQWLHLIILGSTLIAMTYLYVWLLSLRWNQYAKDRRQIPRNNLLIGEKDFPSKRMYALFVNEVYRVQNILKHELKPESSGGGDPGWGKQESKLSGVHFNTSIEKSYYVLEKAALLRRPGLWHRHHRTIRHYVHALRKVFPALPHHLCEEYIQTYERGAFSKETFTYEEYARFMNIVVEMVAIINEKSLQPI